MHTYFRDMADFIAYIMILAVKFSGKSNLRAEIQCPYPAMFSLLGKWQKNRSCEVNQTFVNPSALLSTCFETRCVDSSALGFTKV
jgi:hypothetical protein